MFFLFSCPYQCTFADSCHGGNLAIGLTLSQERQSKIDLLRLELLRSAVLEVRVLPCHCLSCLRAFDNHSPFVLGKRKHYSENQIALNQINDRKYDTEMRAKGITTIIKYGIAFCGKRVQIATE